jgi:enamine deaminase RidA (YjgF/YER057c/UK114 family)
MNDAEVLARIAELGHELPAAPAPVAAYVPCVISGTTAYVAGQVPWIDGQLVAPGHLGDDVSVEDGVHAAERAALQALAVLREALGGSFERLVRLLHVTVYVSATPGFTDHPRIGNGCSELLIAALGDPGRHARAAVGMGSLPLGASVEVSVVAEVEPADTG